MSHAHFSSSSAGPCWTCVHWAGWDHSGIHGVCHRDGHTRVEASPAQGCAFFTVDPSRGAERPPSVRRLLPRSVPVARAPDGFAPSPGVARSHRFP